MDWTELLLPIVTFLPAAGAVLILLLCHGEDQEAVARNARYGALWTSVCTFVVSLAIWILFDPSAQGYQKSLAENGGYQFVVNVEWIPALGLRFHIGVDGISMLFVMLSTFLTPICILASWNAVQKRVKEYMVAFLLLETLMVGMFCALDLVLFYLFFEGVLIPMFLIIGVWGGENRTYAAFKFFLYTLAGSVLMLVAILAIYLETGTTSVPELIQNADLPANMQLWLWLAFFASFAVKVPMWPVHTWLPDAHVQAPTAGSVILAGVLLKMGAYGFVRFSIPIMPIGTDFFTPMVFTLSCVAVVYTSLVALAQTDMKKLIAYSSVAHMGYVTIGIFTMTEQGLHGGLFQMLSHGIVSAALFLVVGVVYDRLHTRDIGRYGGLVHRMPMYAFVFMIFMLGSVGLPGTSGFVGEFLVLVGAYQASTWLALIAGTGLVLGAAYMLLLYRGVVFGKLEKEDLKGMLDLSKREIAIFAPLVVMVLWMGIYPSSFIDVFDDPVAELIKQHEASLAAHHGTSSVADAVVPAR